MPDVVTFGEAMLRLSPPGYQRLEQARALELWPAGSELNVAVGLDRLGTPAGWVSRLPRNPLGRIVETHARAGGVDTSRVLWSDDGRLGLYFVEVGRAPRPSSAVYDRRGSAFATLEPASLDWRAILAGARAFHVSGITPALSDACARATADALAVARAAGCRTSYDVNLRRRLTTPEQARRRLEEVAPALDTLFCSEGDAEALFGPLRGDTAGALRERLPVSLVVVSGADSDTGDRVRLAVGDTTEMLRRPPYDAIDPIGSGDAFCAGFLHGLLEGDLRRALELGDALSVLKLSIPGDFPLVTREEVDEAVGGGAAGVRR